MKECHIFINWALLIYNNKIAILLANNICSSFGLHLYLLNFQSLGYFLKPPSSFYTFYMIKFPHHIILLLTRLFFCLRRAFSLFSTFFS